MGQNWVRGYMGRRKFVTMQAQRVALTVVQRNIRKYIGMKNWSWFYLWVRVKPEINKPRIEDAIKEIKVRSDASVAACQEAEDKAIWYENQHAQLLIDIQSLKEEVESTAGNAASFMENFAVIATQKDEVEKKLQDTCYLVDQEIEGKNDIANKIKDIDVTVHNAKHDLEELEDALLKLTREKETKDHNIRVINDEIAFQEENAKNADEFGSVEDRASHLNKVKSKLEGTIDELNLALGDEHNKKAVIEHNRRKAEGDLRILMESVSDLERSKKDLEGMIFKKEAEVSLLASKHEDEQVDGARVGKNIKDLQIKIDELEDEMKCENQARMKAENSRLKLEAEYNEMMDRLDEAGSATAAQNELFKKREAEASKLRRDIETDNIQHDAAVAAFRKKHNDAVAEMSEQIDHLTKMKQKIDKEKEIMKREGEELKSHFDRLTIDKAHSEKQGKNLQAQILEVQAKYDECYRCIGDYENNKKKISSENTDLVRQLEDLEAQIHSLSKLTITYGAQPSDMQNAAKVENRDRVSILNKYRNLEHDFEGLQEQLHEDAETKHALG